MHGHLNFKTWIGVKCFEKLCNGSTFRCVLITGENKETYIYIYIYIYVYIYLICFKLIFWPILVDIWQLLWIASVAGLRIMELKCSKIDLYLSKGNVNVTVLSPISQGKLGRMSDMMTGNQTDTRTWNLTVNTTRGSANTLISTLLYSRT